MQKNDTGVPQKSASLSYKRVMSIDYGHARLGVAVSDPTRVVAQPQSTLSGDKNQKKAAKNIVQEIDRLTQEKGYSIDTIVLGLPLHLNGTESQRSLEVKKLQEMLEQLLPSHIQVILFDERLTTLQAERIMKESGYMSRKERTKKVDSVSATILLQSYLDSIYKKTGGVDIV